MTAHEKLPAISSLTIDQKATSAEYISTTTTNVVEVVLSVTKDVSQLFEDVPYVQVFAGILLSIIKIRDEIQTEKDMCQELIDKILRRSKVILDGLRKAATSPNRDRLKDTKEKLDDYNSLLQGILNMLTKTTQKGMRAKLDRAVNRNSRIQAIAKYDRLIDNFNTDFVIGLLLNLVDPPQPTHAPPGPANVFYKPVPRPGKMMGRDQEKSKIVETLLNHTLPRITILGAGGMGKTTLALTALHDHAIVERYPSRHFVSCEAVTSSRGLILAIAHSLRIPDPEHDGGLIETILSSFRGNSVLCLDNLETIWEDEAIREEVEELLSHLDQLPHLALIITMRGAQRPSGVSWSEPLLPPLNKLDDADSQLIFNETRVPIDEFAEKLLRVADGVPLAIKLIVSQLREEGETPRVLWARWEQTHTRAISTGSKHRLSNLDTSIHLSVYSPRMQADPNAMLVFAMLSSLSDGFPCRQEAIDELRTHLPGPVDLPGILTTLRRVSLVYVDGPEGHTRYRMLVPIREFGTKLQVENPLDDCLTAFYAETMTRFGDSTDPANHGIISPELLNLRQVFLRALNRDQVDEKVVTASITYTLWTIFTGNPTSEIMDLAKEKTIGLMGLHAQCLTALSRVYLHEIKFDEAKSLLDRAIELHQQVHNVLGEAVSFQILGTVYFRRDKLGEAEEAFTKAVELHQQVHDVRGEAYNVQNLGLVALRRAKLVEAEVAFTKAMELHQQVHDVRGEAYNVQNLGEVYLRQDKLDEAEVSLTKAVELHQQTRDMRGEARDFRHLGEVYMRRDKLDEAELYFKKAIDLSQQSRYVIGEANGVQFLGDVYMRRNTLDEAEMSFAKARELHQRAHDVLGEAYDVQKLGEAYLRRNKLDEAEVSLTKAVELHQETHDMRGEACDFRCLGEVYMRRDKLDEAESHFKKAIDLSQQSHYVLEEANSTQILGGVYMRRNALDKAEVSFTKARELHRQARNVLGEAYDVQNLGEVYLRWDKLDEAEASFTTAMELHEQADDAGGKAFDLQNLGELYLRRDKLDEAEVSLTKAMELHQKVHEVRGEARDIHKLGEVYLRCARLDEAESAFKKSIDLSQQSRYVLGEALSVQYLGELYLQRDKIDEAEVSFIKAMKLHQQGHDVLGEAYDIQDLGVAYLRRDKLDDAEASFTRAMELHQQTHDARGEAEDIQHLGTVYLRRDKLAEAESAFRKGIKLHQQSRNVRGEATGIGNLGAVCLQRDELDEAEAYFNQAMELHRRARDVVGEADNVQNLGKVYFQRNKLDEAERYFTKALLLHRQCQSSFNEAADLRFLEQIRARREEPPTA